MQHARVNVRLVTIADCMQMSDLRIPWNVTTLCTMWIPAAVTELSCLFANAFPLMHLWNQRKQIWKQYMCNISPETTTNTRNRNYAQMLMTLLHRLKHRTKLKNSYFFLSFFLLPDWGGTHQAGCTQNLFHLSSHSPTSFIAFLYEMERIAFFVHKIHSQPKF